MDKILLRREAMKMGESRYFTGIPCKNGHISERYTVSALCIGCVKGARRKLQQNLTDRYRRNAECYIDHTIRVHPLDLKMYEIFGDLVESCRRDRKAREPDLQNVIELMQSLNFHYDKKIGLNACYEKQAVRVIKLNSILDLAEVELLVEYLNQKRKSENDGK